MKTREQVLKENYGFSFGDYKYIPQGSKILEYIDQDIVVVKYKKIDDAWTNSYSIGHINSINDFEPTTMTYMCNYTIRNDDGTEEINDIRIQPEGFSYENAEETGEATRLVPLELHYKLAFDELFHKRVSKLYEERNSLSSENLINLSESKEQSTQLRYSRNIYMVMKLEDGTILHTRVLKISYKHRQGTTYSLTVTNEDRSWSVLVDASDTEYDFENGIGKFKLIDLISD